MSVSVIIPYIESSDLILKTADSVKNQRSVNTGEIELLVIDVSAEQNAIIQAAKLGISLEGATMYVTHQPCVICTRMIINSGIKKVIYKNGYPDEFALELFKQSDVELIKYSDLQ